MEVINGETHTFSYTYDNDQRVSTVATGDTSISYEYDGYSRVTTLTTKNSGTTVLTESFTYRSPAAGFTSTQVATYTITGSNYSVTYAYTYDANGNITSVSDGTNTTTYVYDSMNQLVRENNQAADKTWTWTYDNAGNILTRSEYEYTTESLDDITPADTVSYTYGDDSWGDLLTAYDDVAITHDAIGNPLNDGTWSYTWENGRQLASMTNGETTWSYEYNADGLRTKRTNGATTYEYIYSGDLLVQLVVNSSTESETASRDVLYFAGNTVTYNDTVYYYVTNLQGDVIAILNVDGTAVVTYAYDAWGNILSTTGSMADTLGTLNPLLYRGYVYDSESGLYYLQSRYYDPEVGRFINADALVSTGQGVLGNNMFAYCNNNPVSYLDSSGTVAFAVNSFYYYRWQ